MQSLKNVVVRLLRNTADKIDSDNCELSEEEAMAIISNMTHVPLSKEMSCRYLNISRSKFDEMVRDNEIPKGRKRVGFKELTWWRDELNDVKMKLKENS